jgi:hypothetical protein
VGISSKLLKVLDIKNTEKKQSQINIELRAEHQPGHY